MPLLAKVYECANCIKLEQSSRERGSGEKLKEGVASLKKAEVVDEMDGHLSQSTSHLFCWLAGHCSNKQIAQQMATSKIEFTQLININ